jgi:hypothetical protein
MYIDNILFWTTILSGIIIGLVVGGILGYIGYLFWKKQHLYSKKLDAYTSFKASLYNYCNMIQFIYKHKLKDNKIEDRFYIELNVIIRTVLKDKQLFYYYCSQNYNQTFDEIFDIYKKIREEQDIKMTYEELKEYLENKMTIFESIDCK